MALGAKAVSTQVMRPAVRPAAALLSVEPGEQSQPSEPPRA